MFQTIVATILVAGAVTGLMVARRAHRKSTPDHSDSGVPWGIPAALGAVALAGGVAILVSSCAYTQDPGEAVVLRSFTGQLVGQTTEQGLHWKAPWVTGITFDVRNNTVTYVGDGSQGDHSGGSATGPQITFQDKDGVTGNLDIVVRYSVQGDSVLDIYSNFQTQQSFVSKVVTNDVRSIARNVPAKYSTIEVYNNREKLGQEIKDQLQTALSSNGILIEDVALQEVRYSDDVRQRFDDAQAARIAVDKAQAEQQQAQVEAQTKVIEAQGVADANAVLAKSLTPEVLQQKYIDALSKASTVYVVPAGSTPMVGIGSALAPTSTTSTTTGK